MLLIMYCPTCNESGLESEAFPVECPDPFHRTPLHNADELTRLLTEALPFLDGDLASRVQQVIADRATRDDIDARMRARDRAWRDNHPPEGNR